MRLLIVSPDYASHAGPLVEIGRAWRRDHGDVVLATGPAVREMVTDAGLEWVELRLGKGSNPGVIEERLQPVGEDAHLRAFFDATRAGPVATLRYQADARRHDLMHDPDSVLDRLREIVEQVQPDRVAVDHVAFGARAALHAMGLGCATVVLGHPSALPTADEIYGLPDEWPSAMRPSDDELADLHVRCRAAVGELSATASDFLQRRAPERAAIGDLTSTEGQPTIYAYPQGLHSPTRAQPANSVFVGSLAREQSLGSFPLPDGDGLRVTVALGSFLSARGDVLHAAVRAADEAGWRLTLAHGSTPLDELGHVPTGAVVARHLPQVAVLQHTDVFINHGGNGSVTEAVVAGVPMVVLPFSTDQFAGAAAIERAGVGSVLAPNDVTAASLRAAVEELVASGAAGRMAALADDSIRDGGPRRAARAIAELSPPSR
jgi:MGT family glycosyltransferase